MTTRRRFLSILAGASILPALGAQASTGTNNWRGIALGAEARIILDHPNGDALIPMAVAEIRRLEGIFSLYQQGSQLSRLNRDGFLQNPAQEMIELLSVCSGLNRRTAGAFDPTVQSLWSLYAREVSAGTRPDAAQLAGAIDLTGWDHVQFAPSAVSFDRPGVQITLNGIAQGYIADRVTRIFRDEGVQNVMVNTGEISAIGKAPDGHDWQVFLGDRDGPSVNLENRAVATSAPLGTTFDGVGSLGHIIDPRTGISGGNWSQVSVVANTAAEADGLSTAFCLMKRQEIQAATGNTKVYLR